jgi:hypothetical protein
VKMGEQRKDEMSIQVGNNRPCEVVLGHFGFWPVCESKNKARPRAHIPESPDRLAHPNHHTMTSVTRNLPWLIKDLGTSIIGQVRTFKRAYLPYASL